MRRTTRRSAAALLLAAAIVMVAVAPSFAADQQVTLSFDGRHWSANLTRPLFSPAFRWVPGDVGTRSFWVRCDGPSAARMSIAVVTGDPDNLLSDKDVTLRARVAGGPWFTLRNGASDRRLSEEAIQRGERRRVDIRAIFDPASPNRSQRSRLPLRFVVTLTQAVKEGGSSGGANQTSGVLPGTGSDITPGVLWAAAILIAGGTTILAARRRQSDDGEWHAQG